MLALVVVFFKDSIEYYIIDSIIFYATLPEVDVKTTYHFCVSFTFSRV